MTTGQETTTVERAVVFLDLVSFTTLTDVHGDLEAVRAVDEFTASVHAASGPGLELVKTLGDGALLLAEDPRTAVQGTVRIIEHFHEQLGLPDVAGGINLGAVVQRDGDILGGTVNVASRLADLAGPSEILVTRAVVEAAGGLGTAVVPRGPVELKGVRDPVEVFAIHPCAHDHPVTTDPVCGMRVVADATEWSAVHEGTRFWFCSRDCVVRFREAPHRHLGGGATR